MHDYDKLLRAALMTAHRYARGGYADRGFVEGEAAYDPMGNVIVGGGSEDTSSPLYKAIEAASIGLGKAGAAVGEPLRRGAENYLGNVGQAFHESGEYAKQGLENTVSDKGPLYNTSGPLQYALGSMGQAFSPLTGAAMSAGQAATQLTGNPNIGSRVEFVGGMMDPSHVGMLKGAAAIPMAARTAAKAEEAAQAVALAKQARELSPLGFYSHGAETAAGLQQAKGTPEQFAAMLQRAGVKPAEMEGFGEAFAGRPSVTREEIAQHFKQNMPQVEETVLGHNATAEDVRNYFALSPQEFDAITPQEFLQMKKTYLEAHGESSPSKFSQYTLPGGENYREVLLKMPNKQERDFGFEWFDPATQTSSRNTFATQAEAQAAAPEGAIVSQRQIAERNPAFKSQHWDEPNVLAHLRMSDRTGPNGEKILHVEEIQSDWGQKGKKVGFSDPASKAAAKEKMDQLSTKYDELGRERRLAEKEMAELPDYNDRFEQLQNRVSEIGQERDLLSNQMAELRSTIKGDAIPSAPYVTNTQAWTDLALKRALREAAEGGYDKLVWTPGAEQAKRYKLSNHVNAIDYMREGEDAYRLGITNKHGEGIDLPKDVFTAKELEDYLGKEVAQKIVADEGKSYQGRNHKTLEGLDLEVGGSGMKGYYDKIVPTQLSKLVKKLDPEAKIEMGRLPVQGETRLAPDIARELGMTVEEIQALPHEQRSALINSVRHSIAAPSLTITPKMREAILKGQTAFKRGGTIPFGPEAAQRAVQIAKQQAGRR